MNRHALAEEWRERLEDFAQSEMSVQEWCDFNRVPLHQYYYWKRRLAKLNPDSATNPRFLTLEVLDTALRPASTGGVTLRIAGATIEVAEGFDPERLRQVVRALATQPC